MAGETTMLYLSFCQGDLILSFLVFTLYGIKRKKAEILMIKSKINDMNNMREEF